MGEYRERERGGKVQIRDKVNENMEMGKIKWEQRHGEENNRGAKKVKRKRAFWKLEQEDETKYEVIRRGR